VPHLGGAEPVQELHAEPVLPAMIQLHRERLAGRGGEAERREVARPGRRDRRASAGSSWGRSRAGWAGGARSVRRALPGCSARGRGRRRRRPRRGRRGSRRWRSRRRAWGRRSRRRLRVPDDPLRVALRGVGVRGVGLDDRLRVPARPAGEEPEGGVVPVAGEVLEPVRDAAARRRSTPSGVATTSSSFSRRPHRVRGGLRNPRAYPGARAHQDSPRVLRRNSRSRRGAGAG
jgi:hypothetical protein